MLVIRHDRDVTLGEVVAVARGGRVALDPDTASLLDRRRAEIEAFVAAHPSPAYGFNRGFGALQDRPVADVAALQRNLLRSHAAGVGPDASHELVRCAMVLRALSLCRGASGVRSVIVRQIVDMLEAGITPCVPRYGSVGASGDLAPLSHLGLAMMGEGRVRVRGGPEQPAQDALAAAGLAPVVFAMKEGLAVNNGTVFSAAHGVLATVRLLDLARVAAVATAVGVEVFLGSEAPFRADLHAWRAHPGPVRVAGWLTALLAGSPLREVHRDPAVDGEVQDPYSLRCTPAILGTALDLITDAERVLTLEINSVTDNPLVLTAADGRATDIVSGGHFHAMPVAVRLYGLVQAMCIMAQLSNTRCARYVDDGRNRGLPACLIWPGGGEDGVRSGLMIPEYVSAALTNALWGAAMPSHLFSLPTAAGQEDHVSMAATLGARVLDMVPRLEEALAIELMLGAQAAALRLDPAHRVPLRSRLPASEAASRAAGEAVAAGPLAASARVVGTYGIPEPLRSLSPAGERVRGWVGRVTGGFIPLREDLSPSDPMRALAASIADGALLRDVVAVVALA